mmetsp:Transcript_11691/g.15163  ORF Transcript_11691/g.15163 Transcript_11691/m.15163 type:complete len:606 (+) Transcript_11691:83-1900(+)
MSENENPDEIHVGEVTPDSTAESIARLTMSFGLNMAKVFLHSPAVKDEHPTTGFDIAHITEKAFEAANSALFRVGLGRDEFSTTGQSLGSVLRLLTQFTGPVVGINSDEMYNAIKAYAKLQQLTRENERIPYGGPKPNVVELRRYSRFIMASYGALATKFLGILSRTDMKIFENKAAITYLTGVDANECLVEAKWRTNWTGSIFKPGYYILLDHMQKELIVAVRGSYRFQDALTDLMCEDEPFDFTYHKKEDVHNAADGLDKVVNSLEDAVKDFRLNHKDMTIGELKDSVQDVTGAFFAQMDGWLRKQASTVRKNVEESAQAEDAPLERQDSTPPDHRKIKGTSHRGFVLSAQTLADDITPIVLETLKEYPDYQLVVCGHSLGAAVATLLTLMWAKIPELSTARCYSVAQPCTVSRDIAESSMAINRIQSIILGDDLVPRLSFANANDMRNAIIRIAQDQAPPEYNEDGVNVNENVPLSTWVINNAANKNEDECRALFQPVIDTIRAEEMTSRKLYPAGTIWHVVDEEKGIDGGAVMKPPHAFSEIVIGSRMFINHVPHKYSEAADPTLPLPKKTEKDRVIDKKEAEKIQKRTFFKSALLATQES